MFDFPSSPTVGQVYAPASGPSWTWDGTAWKSFQTLAEMQIARTFIPGASGAATTYTYNKPANLRHVEFEGVAAGGSGAPAIATGASVSSFGSGGGGGSWGKKLFPAATLPASVTITIGAPGAPVSTSTNGNPAADTTFGSLITLPGGRGGVQGANTAYTTYNVCAGSGPTAMPTGCDVAAPGESSEGCWVHSAMAVPVIGLANFTGRAGGSPWGKNTYFGHLTTGLTSTSGYGYGWGSGGSTNTASAALRSSVAGGPGAVLLTEYLAVPSIEIVQTTPVGWRFEWVSTTQCRLMPYNGNGIKIKGLIHPIPAGGVAIANTGLGNNSMWDIYAYVDANGQVALESVVIGGHSPDATAGNVGTEIKTADPTRSLVGKVVTGATGLFDKNDTRHPVRSWMNRGSLALYTSTLGANTAVPASQTDMTNLTMSFVNWANEKLTMTGVMSWFSGTASTVTYLLKRNNVMFGYGLAINVDTSARVTPATISYGAYIAEGFSQLSVSHGCSPIGPTSYSACYAHALLME